MWLNIYCEHNNCKTPNDDEMIWRYIKDKKITIDGIGIDVIPNMLETNCLHFTRADQFIDEWEGTPSKEDYSKYDFLIKCRKRTAINCWSIDDFESYLMWETYVKEKNGIVIQSSIKRLKDSFEESVGNDEYIGPAEYCKFEGFQIDTNRLQPVLRKRIQYKGEAEVRVISIKQNNGVFDENGINIPVSFDKLIEKIYISPKSDDLFHDKIKGLFKKYKPKIKVLSSELAKKRPKNDSKDIPYKVCYKEWCEADASGNLNKVNDINGNAIINYTKLKEK